MNEKILSTAGLTAEQSRVYLFLIENGLSPAKIIATKTNIGRALTYKILRQLIALDLVQERNDIGKIALFLPGHPHKIKELIIRRKTEFEEISKSFEPLYGKLSSDYNMLAGKPNVQFYEGIGGLKSVYDDILENGSEIKIISSPMGRDDAEILNLIKEQIRKQVARNITTKAITPLETNPSEARRLEDKSHLIERKVIPAEKLNIPAQIIIYKDKVAITNFKGTTITVQIESKYIAETFRIMFDYIWSQDK